MALFAGLPARHRTRWLRAPLLATLVCAQLLKVGAEGLVDDEKEVPCGMLGALAKAAETVHGGCCMGGVPGW